MVGAHYLSNALLKGSNGDNQKPRSEADVTG